MNYSLRLLTLLATALCALAVRAQPALSGLSTSVLLDEEGAWVYLFIDGSAGPRSVLISAAGPGFASNTSSRVVSDPQIEVLDPSGNRIASNDDRADSLLGDASLPTYARTAKDAALRVSLTTGTYVVRVSGVGGATGVAGIDVIDSSTRPGIASWALRARGDSSVTSVRVRYAGTGNINLAMLLSGPNLPVTNPLADPQLTYSSFSAIGTINVVTGASSFAATTTPVINTWDQLTGGMGTVTTRFRSPASGDGRNAGHSFLTSLPPAMPITLEVRSQTPSTNGMFLLELHNVDNATLRAPVVYVPPQSRTLATGNDSVITSLVGGDASTLIGYEKDGVSIGALSANFSAHYILLSAGAANAGSYRLRATSTVGSALSEPGIVTVTPPAPFITSSSPSTFATVGTATQLSVTTTGTGLTYQWSKNSVAIAGATAATLAFSVVQESDAGSYTLRIANAGGSVVSNPNILTITLPPPPSIFQSPPSIVTVAGTVVELVALVNGSGLTYQWFKDGVALSGATQATLRISPARESDSGEYTARITNLGGSVVTSPATLKVNPTDIGRLTNLSVRAFAGLGDRVLIVGFTLRGPGSKSMVIRAVGPGLAGFGVPNTISDPRLGVFVGANEITNNDNWTGNDGRSLGAFALAPGSRDAVVAQNLSAQGFTSQINGVGGTVGEAIVEVYDGFTANSDLRLVNLSTRTQLEDGQRLIVGLTVTGRTPIKLAIRAVGPTLASFGVPDAHPDPKFELYSTGASAITQNDQWQGDDGRSAGAFPLLAGSKDAALVGTYPPGPYSVHVLGAPGTRGIVLVEVYEVP
jgi:hypothetical protein